LKNENKKTIVSPDGLVITAAVDAVVVNTAQNLFQRLKKSMPKSGIRNARPHRFSRAPRHSCMCLWFNFVFLCVHVGSCVYALSSAAFSSKRGPLLLTKLHTHTHTHTHKQTHTYIHNIHIYIHTHKPCYGRSGLQALWGRWRKKGRDHVNKRRRKRTGGGRCCSAEVCSYMK